MVNGSAAPVWQVSRWFNTTQPLDLVGKRVRHGFDTGRVGRGELLDEVDDAREAVDVHGHLRLGDLEACEVGDPLDLGACQAHLEMLERTGKNSHKSYTRPCGMS